MNLQLVRKYLQISRVADEEVPTLGRAGTWLFLQPVYTSVSEWMKSNKMFRNTDRKTNTVGDTVASIQKVCFFALLEMAVICSIKSL